MNNDMPPGDARHHLASMLMRESLVDRDLQADTETPVIRMLPDTHVIKIGGRSIMDGGRKTVYAVVETLTRALETKKLIISTDGGARSRHVFSIGLDLGLPTGALGQFAMADSLGTAHMLGALLARSASWPFRPRCSGTCCRCSVTAPGAIFSGSPPYSVWEHPPERDRIPPHRTDAGTFLLAECFGSRTLTLVKDVDGVFDRDPHKHAGAQLIHEIGARELAARNLDTLPFDRVLLDLLASARLVERFQIVNGLVPGRIEAALAGERAGTVVHAGA